MAGNTSMYAQLGVFKYQTFDPATLKFSEYPVINPRSYSMEHSGSDADNEPKKDDIVFEPEDEKPVVENNVEVVEDAVAKCEYRLSIVF